MNKRNIIYPMFLLLLILSLKFSTLYLDYYDDERKYAVQAKYLSIHGLLSKYPGYPVHVPFFLWILAVGYKLFGESPFLSHLIVLIFSFIGTFFTYLIGKHLYDEKIGIMASLLLLFSPVYFSISGRTLYDVPLIAMATAVLYFYLRKKIPLYLIFSCILVLIKEPGTFVILAILIHLVVKREKFNNILIHGLPLIVVLIWGTSLLFGLDGNIHELGMTYPDFFERGILFPIGRLFANIYQTFVWYYKWILSLIILFVFFKYKELFSLEYLPFTLILIFYLLAFSFLPIYTNPRYFLTVNMIFFVFSAFSLNHLFKNKSWMIFVIIIMLFISCYRWNWGIKGLFQDPVFHSSIFYEKFYLNPPVYIESRGTSMDYIDVVDVEMDTRKFIINNYPSSTIVWSGRFYKSIESYVNVGYADWSTYNITFLPLTKENIFKGDLVVYESNSFISDEILEILSGMIQIKKIEKNGIYIVIYRP